jgi:flagellar basal-body rod protein FlgG
MDPSIRTAATGMMAQQRRIEVIANNLANVNTTSFKRSRAHFEDLLYQTVQGPGVGGAGQGTTDPVQVGRGTRLAAVQRVQGQGPLEPTGRPLDLAIEGEGLFRVQLPDGATAYTRDGSLSISADGTLVTHGGYELMPGIVIPEEATGLMINRTGVVTVEMRSAADVIELGRIELARFANEPGLVALGENLYAETPASGPPIHGFPQDNGFGRIVQGHLEASNVEIVTEMVDMIAALRAYEINSQAVKASEEMARTANSMVR